MNMIKTFVMSLDIPTALTRAASLLVDVYVIGFIARRIAEQVKSVQRILKEDSDDTPNTSHCASHCRRRAYTFA